MTTTAIRGARGLVTGGLVLALVQTGRAWTVPALAELVQADLCDMALLVARLLEVGLLRPNGGHCLTLGRGACLVSWASEYRAGH